MYQFQKKVTGTTVCARNCSIILSIIFLIAKVAELQIIIIVHRFTYKLPVIFVRF